MSMRGRNKLTTKKIKIIELTKEQRRSYAEKANKADKKRMLLAIYLKKKRKIKSKKLKKTKIHVLILFLFLFVNVYLLLKK